MISIADIKKRKQAESDRGYYGGLYRKYGRSYPLSFITHTKMLFIADTADRLKRKNQFSESVFWDIQEPVDIIFLLGGISHDDMKLMEPYFGIREVYGIRGDYDEDDIYSRYNIPEFNEKIIISHDIRFAGLQGALSYKPGILGYTHESSLRAIENMSDADIFITHAPVWDEDNYNAAIAGLKGISEYIYKNHIPYHFCGHIGEKITKTLSNGCVSQSVNGSLVITI